MADFPSAPFLCNFFILVFRKNILFCVWVLLCFESFKIVHQTYSGVYILSRSCSTEFKTLCLPKSVCTFMILRKASAMVIAADVLCNKYLIINLYFRKVKKGSLLIDSSTIDPAVSKELAKAVEKMGAVFMDAPVSGGKSSLTAYLILDTSLCLQSQPSICTLVGTCCFSLLYVQYSFFCSITLKKCMLF